MAIEPETFLYNSLLWTGILEGIDTTMKVLIADDDKLLTQLLNTTFRAKGAEVFCAFDSMQTVMAAMKNLPDVIILDVKMPAGSGIDAIQKLKSSVKTANIPVLVMSALTDPDLPDRVKGLGASEFLRKPVEIKDLYEKVCQLAGVSPA